MCFFNNLKQCRLNKNLSQKELAESIGVAPSTYSLYESGKREPDVEKIKLLSEILDVTADYLLFGNVALKYLDNVDGKDDADNIILNSPILTENENYLLNTFRMLSEQGQEYILQTIDMVKDKYKKEDYNSSGMEDVG
jgi:transcriptional regulator with XRE-family HTH domain